MAPHPRRLTFTVIAALMAASPAGAQTPVPFRPDTPGRQISRWSLPCPVVDDTCQLDTQTEPHIAVNPDDPDNAVAVFQQGRYPSGGSAAPGFATTRDGGATWTAGHAPGLTIAITGGDPGPRGSPPFNRATDPVVAFDRKHGVVLFQTLGVEANCGPCGTAVVVNRSTDEGLTWSEPVVTDAGYNLDKNWIAVDNDPASRWYGRSYAVWNDADFGVGYLATSDDGGLSWSGKRAVAFGDQYMRLFAPIVVVRPSGQVVLFAVLSAGAGYDGPTAVRTLYSDDDGDTWWRSGYVPLRPRATNPSGHEPSFYATPSFPEQAFGLRAPPIPSAAVDPATGDLYLAWPSALGRGYASDVFVTRKAGHMAWSEPVNVTAGNLGYVDHFTPAIAAHGGVVHIQYRTRRMPPVYPPYEGATDVGVEYRRSTDAAASWNEAVMLARPSRTDVAAFSSISLVKLRFFGDYAGMAAGAGKAYAVWAQADYFTGFTNNRDNTHQRTFAAAL